MNEYIKKACKFNDQIKSAKKVKLDRKQKLF